MQYALNRRLDTRDFVAATAWLNPFRHPGRSDPDILKAGAIKTIQGDSVEFAFSDGRFRVDEAAAIDAGVECSDGLIQVIDTVLLPREPQSKAAKSSS